MLNGDKPTDETEYYFRDDIEKCNLPAADKDWLCRLNSVSNNAKHALQPPTSVAHMYAMKGTVWSAGPSLMTYLPAEEAPVADNAMMAYTREQKRLRAQFAMCNELLQAQSLRVHELEDMLDFLRAPKMQESPELTWEGQMKDMLDSLRAPKTQQSLELTCEGAWVDRVGIFHVIRACHLIGNGKCWAETDGRTFIAYLSADGKKLVLEDPARTVWLRY